MEDVIVKVFKYNELSDTAKEKARNWYRDVVLNGDFDFEAQIITETMEADVEEAGYLLSGKYSVQWSLSHVQGDFVGLDVSPTDRKSVV